jgi:hypothetical protein
VTEQPNRTAAPRRKAGFGDYSRDVLAVVSAGLFAAEYTGKLTCSAFSGSTSSSSPACR